MLWATSTAKKLNLQQVKWPKHVHYKFTVANDGQLPTKMYTELGIVVNKCVATPKVRAVPIILINITKQNIWLLQPLLVTELFTVEYHEIEHRANMERKRDNINISLLLVAPNTIRVQLEQLEVKPSNISPPSSNDRLIFGSRPNTSHRLWFQGQDLMPTF